MTADFTKFRGWLSTERGIGFSSQASWYAQFTLVQFEYESGELFSEAWRSPR